MSTNFAATINYDGTEFSFHRKLFFTIKKVRNPLKDINNFSDDSIITGRRNETDNYLINTHHEGQDHGQGNFEPPCRFGNETAKKKAEKKK
jgi:hypothetical protein